MMDRPIIIVMILLMVSAIILPHSGSAQTDNVNWSSLRLRKQINSKLTFDIRPIIRINDNISKYQNASIDFSINRKIAEGWSVQFLSRTWFLPDSPLGQFLWADVAHKTKIGAHNISNRIRMHYSLNTNLINPADFIRWQTTISPKVKSKFRPFLSIEPWFQLDGLNAFTRIRYEPGFNIDLGSNYNFTFMWRKQDSISIEPADIQNHIVITLTKLI